MRRVAYICCDPGVPVFGHKGCSVHVQEGIRALRRQGYNVVLFAQRIGGAIPSDLEDMTLVRLPKLVKTSIEAREQSALRVNQRLAEILGRYGPFDFIYERYSLWSFAGLEYARNTGAPGLLEVNAPLVEEQKAHRSLIHEAEAYDVARRAFYAASSLIAVSEQVAAYLCSYHIDAAKVHVIPNGVDPNRFTPDKQPRYPREADRFTVGFVGSLKPWHGVLDLIEAFSILYEEHPQSRLLIVGDGPERTAVESRLSASGIDAAAHFTGAVHPHEIPSYLTSMDVAVAPYPQLDNFYFSPLKAFEYMASGLAFIGSDIGQLGNLVSHNYDGLLYPPGDTQKLASLLVQMAESPKRRKELGLNARKTIIDHYTWDAVGHRLCTIAENTIQEVVH